LDSKLSFRSYVPELIVRRFARSPNLPNVAESETFPAALLFVDISGFTSLAEQLAKQGPIGAEQLSEILNEYFRSLISRIRDYGGDVVKFAGDALLAIWLDEDKVLDAAVSLASRCALDIQKILGANESHRGSQSPLHIGISAGKVTGMHVGGYRERWYYVLTGKPLDQLGVAIHEAKQGDVVLSPEAWKLVSSRGVGIPLSRGCMKIQSTAETPFKQVPFPEVERSTESVLRAYIPDCILSFGESPWLAELRHVTALFVHMTDLEHATSSALDETQRRMLVFQKILDRYEGSIKELIIDDKGPTLIALFGLPPFAHEDDHLRAIRAALEIQAGFLKDGMHSDIGIASGRCFCGIVGGEERREYTVIGEVMNVASRIVQAAQSDQILCDEETFQLAKTRFEFTHKALSVKGKTAVVPVHGPIREVQSSRHGSQIVGRIEERTKLSEYLDDLLSGSSRVVVLEGEPGIGKSRLTLDLLDQASNRGIRRFVGYGDAIEKFTPYHAWRPIYVDLLDLTKASELEQLRKIVVDRLSREPSFLAMAPLLNAVLPLEIADNEITARIPSQVRAESTRDYLTNVLQFLSKENGEPKPLLIVLEDAHWMDSSSWTLAKTMSERIRPLLLVIVTRPFEKELSVDASKLVYCQDSIRLQLGSLGLHDTEKMLCERLELNRVEKSIVETVHERSEGNPFFSQEIAYALRDAGLISIQDGSCKIAPGVVDLRKANFPNTVQGIIASRIDRLGVSQQLTLKVASVIGRQFEFQLLSEIHPAKMESSLLAGDLDNLQRLDLVLREKFEPYLTYLFKHALTQEVTYNLLLYSQRRTLHRAAAEYYEKIQSRDPLSMYPLLAYHWSRAEVDSKALEYTEKAADESFRTGALNEAIDFYTQALTLLDKTVPQMESGQRLHCEFQLGQAYYGLAKWEESQVHLNKSLRLLHHGTPTSDQDFVVSMIHQGSVQLAHLMFPAVFIKKRSVPKAQDNSLLSAVRAYLSIGEMAIWENDIKAIINSVLQALNLADRSGTPSELVQAYGGAAVVFGTIPIHSIARVYRSLARRAAENVGNDLSGLALVFEALGSYETGIAEWENANNDFSRSVEIAEKTMDWSRWEESMGAFGSSLYLQGKFSESTEKVAANAARGRQRGNVAHQGWGTAQEGGNLLRSGKTAEAIKVLEQSLRFLNEKRDLVFRTQALGELAMAYMHSGDSDRGKQIAERCFQLINRSRPSLWVQFEGYAGTAETFLEIWESCLSSPASGLERVRNRARQSCADLWTFARVFPIGEPRAWLCEGWNHRLQKHMRQARRDFNKGLEAAKRLTMPYDEGRLHYEVGRCLKSEDHERNEHLERACKIFEVIGAVYDLELVKKELAR
jgi:class 3 adenylate cyclase/tetratricopeptide (TPR) repeat protein